MINICDADKTKGIYKAGYLFAFLGSGTTCRCCLGMRVALAFVMGLGFGLLALYSVVITMAVVVTFILTMAIVFTAWMFWNKEQDTIAEESE